MITKLLFLDIDGVLTSDKSGTSYHCEDPSAYRPDQECKANVLKVASAVPGLKVVVHSSWTTHTQEDRPCFMYHGQVFDSPLNGVCQWLIEYDLLLGLTSPGKRNENGSRIIKKDKILEWLNANKERLGPNPRVAVIDDDIPFNGLPDFNCQSFPDLAEIRFFPINPNEGFSEKDAGRVIEWFNRR